ncbi:hypothetical protein HN51_032432 [Arachis hypogaea]|uniref:uncharacterized protein n=1 Tax=Arachis hypogaea TaxID=3818 RepID=UPI000DEC8C25|nr:uncharacterized protein LOC112717791 [Arachis hypogaea]
MATSDQKTLVCVKQVKQGVVDEWDESMPLPGDIIEGFSEHGANDDSFTPVKASSELISQLGKIDPRVEFIWIKVRRGNKNLVKLQARIVPQKGSILKRKYYTIQATTDDRHVADLGDLTLDQCTALQEMSMKAINVEGREFGRSGIKYDWKMKVGTYLPDQWCSVISSILFMPLVNEQSMDATTARCMAWFSAAISSGVPLVFVNIQTEQVDTQEKTSFSGKETSVCSKQQIHNTNKIIHGIRLWFLPGLSEISIELIPKPTETRFGMEIKQTEEGFVYIYSVMRGSVAEGAGLGELYEEAIASGFLLVISRLEGKSIMPKNVCSGGLIHCCNQYEINETFNVAIEQLETIEVHVMAWPNNQTQPIGFASLLAPNGSFPTHQYHYDHQKQLHKLTHHHTI